MPIHLLAANTLKYVVLGSAIALLYACGGGGGGSDPEPSDTSPNSFVFNSVANVTPGAEVISNEVVVSGINAPATISAAGGSYSIAGGSFTNTPGTITNGQSVRVKVNAVALANAPAQATLTIGGTSASFLVTTAPELSTSPPPPASSSLATTSSSQAPILSSAASSLEAVSSSVASSVTIVVPASSAPVSSLGLSSSARSSTQSSNAISSSSPSSSSMSSGSLSSSLTISSTSSMTASSSAVSSSAVSGTAWVLDTAASYLNFVSAKNTHTLEVSHFTGLTGDISMGVATLVIDLNSVNSGIALRDERLRDLLFQTIDFPTATATVKLPVNLLGSLAVGANTEQDITAELDLHGVKTTITTKLSVQKLGTNRIVVQSIAPVLLKTSDYALSDGIEALRAAVGIASISTAVPVDFTLIFDAR